ncbi:MAG: molybdopterin-dependent oxidoreductase [Janthinobacterium lividum]
MNHPNVPERSTDSTPMSDSNLEQKTHAADEDVLAASRQHTRRSFLGAAAAVAAGFGVYHYIDTAPSENMQPRPLQDAYAFNAAASRTLLRDEALAPTYPLGRAEVLRVNGIYGLKKDLLPESWRLQVVGMKNAAQHPRFVPDVTAWEYQYQTAAADEDKGHDTKVDPSKESTKTAPGQEPGAGKGEQQAASKSDQKMMSSIKMAPASMLQQEMKKEGGNDNRDTGEDENHTGRRPRGKEEAGESDSTLSPNTPGVLLQLADITRLPRVELVTQFKCIEGWSQIVHWAGVRMADFLEMYPPELIDGKEPRYVYMETPDGDYYTGYDLHVMRHPQTLLVTEMMGAPLTQNHGAPLRLHMPTKYGYKQIKRIGLIAFTNDKPDDYWTKLGYDWYAGL